MFWLWCLALATFLAHNLGPPFLFFCTPNSHIWIIPRQGQNCQHLHWKTCYYEEGVKNNNECTYMLAQWRQRRVCWPHGWRDGNNNTPLPQPGTLLWLAKCGAVTMPCFHWNCHVSWLSPALQMRATFSLAYTSAQKHVTLDVIMPIRMVDFPLANTTIHIFFEGLSNRFQPVTHFAIFWGLPPSHIWCFMLLIVINILKMYCMHDFGHSFHEFIARVWQCNLQLLWPQLL